MWGGGGWRGAPRARHSLGAHRVLYFARHARRIEGRGTDRHANMTTMARAGPAAASTRASPGIAPRETRDAARCGVSARAPRGTSRGGRARLGATRGGSRPVRALLGDQEVRSPPARRPWTRARASRATPPARDHRRGTRSHLPEGRAVSRGKIPAAPSLRAAPTRARERPRRSRRATSHPPRDPRNPPRSSTRRPTPRPPPPHPPSELSPTTTRPVATGEASGSAPRR